MAETESSAGEQRKMPKKAHLEPHGLHRPENMYWMSIGICIRVFTNAALYFPCSMEFPAVSDQRQIDAIIAARGHHVAIVC